VPANYLSHLTLTCDHPAHGEPNRAWSYAAKDRDQCRIAAEADGWRWRIVGTSSGPVDRVTCRACARPG